MDSVRRQEIEKLYQAASAWDPDQRAARLREACGADGELLREVESLLAAGDSTQAFAIGTEIGCYRIESILGEGGMGIVYRALDTRLKRPAAVKVLTEEIASAAARRRFQREAQAASSLNHPHILTVYDAGDCMDANT
jgi:serine/threonine protein kinase